MRYASIFAKKYGTLVQHSFFVVVRYASKTEIKYDTLVWYGLRCEVRSTQILTVPYRTAILVFFLKEYKTAQRQKASPAYYLAFGG